MSVMPFLGVRAEVMEIPDGAEWTKPNQETGCMFVSNREKPVRQGPPGMPRQKTINTDLTKSTTAFKRKTGLLYCRGGGGNQ